MTLSNRIECRKCHNYYCVAHRDPADHNCVNNNIYAKRYAELPNKSKNEVCIICSKRFSEVEELIQHCELVHNNQNSNNSTNNNTNKNKREICPICGKSFDNMMN